MCGIAGGKLRAPRHLLPLPIARRRQSVVERTQIQADMRGTARGSINAMSEDISTKTRFVGLQASLDFESQTC